MSRPKCRRCSPRLLQRSEIRGDRRRGYRDCECEQDDDGRMADREKPEADADRPLAALRISLRVTLSMAAMWSASAAWRRPKL